MNIFREKLVYCLYDLKVWVLLKSISFILSQSLPPPTLSLSSFSYSPFLSLSPLSPNLLLSPPFFLPFTPAGCWQEDAFSAVPRSAITFFACRYFVISSAFCHAVTLSDELVSGDWGRGVREIWQFISERGVNSVQRPLELLMPVRA